MMQQLHLLLLMISTIGKFLKISQYQKIQKLENVGGSICDDIRELTSISLSQDHHSDMLQAQNSYTRLCQFYFETTGFN